MPSHLQSARYPASFYDPVDLLQDTGGKSHLITVQALSDADRKEWMLVMDGKEPQYVQSKVTLTCRSRLDVFKRYRL